MPLFDLFWAMAWVFLLIAWLSTIVLVVGDVLRRRDLGGLAKAAWVLLVIAVPWLGVFSYVIVAGRGMAHRFAADQAARAAGARQRAGLGFDSTPPGSIPAGGFDTQRGRVIS